MDIFLATRNSDLTEGRGPIHLFGIYTDPEDAVEAVKGQGVMGYGDGSVYVVKANTTLSKGAYSNLVYGYRRANGVWGYGYVVDSVYAPEPDPEYLEYLRLHEKYGNVGA